MTELPLPGDDDVEDPWHDQLVEVGHDSASPEVQSIVALVLSVASLCGSGLGWRAASRLLPSDPRWITGMARAAVAIGLLSLVLRLVLAVIAAGSEEPSGFRF